MPDADIKIETRQLLERLNGLLRKIGKPEPVLHVIGAYLVEMIRKNIRSEGHGEWEKSGAAQARGGQTLRQTGKFYNSIAYEVTGNEVAAGSNAIQARLMYEGGEIRPKNVKFLTIPIHKLAMRKRMSDFADKKTYPLFSAKGTGVVMLDRGKGEDIPIFALVKKVTIPGWDYLKMWPEDEQRIGNIIGRYVTE